MAASNSSEAPFLIYLTVFKSRVGIGNVVLANASYGYLPLATLERQIKKTLSGRTEIDAKDKAHAHVFRYLREKKLIGESPQPGGRYPEWTLRVDNDAIILKYKGQLQRTLPVFHPDLWFADPRIKSTVGLPTPENVGELIEMSHQLRLLTRTKNSWTAAGHSVSILRGENPAELADGSNPFLLGIEGVGLLRQILSEDRLMLAEVLRTVRENPHSFTRDDIAAALPDIAARAYKKAEATRCSPAALAEAKKLVKLLRTTKAKFAGKKGGPGVLEHRTAPRLEWLTDFGALSKKGIPKNAFEYQRVGDADLLANLLDVTTPIALSPEDIALRYWREADAFSQARDSVSGLSNLRAALIKSYGLLERNVGPTPIIEVCFVALMFCGISSYAMADASKELVVWATQERAITLSGGRYVRGPTFVHIAPSLVKEST